MLEGSVGSTEERLLELAIDSPLNSLPRIEHENAFSITSRILARREDWLSKDSIVRADLFAETIQFRKQRG